MKKFTIPVFVYGQRSQADIYVAEPAPQVSHPLALQDAWHRDRGTSIPLEVMDSFAKLHKIATDNNVSFEELCGYAMGQALDDTDTDPSADADDRSAPIANPLEEGDG